MSRFRISGRARPDAQRDGDRLDPHAVDRVAHAELAAVVAPRGENGPEVGEPETVPMTCERGVGSAGSAARDVKRCSALLVGTKCMCSQHYILPVGTFSTAKLPPVVAFRVAGIGSRVQS